MTVNPVPSVAITLATGGTLTFTTTAASGTVSGLPVLLLDDLSVDWGRSAYLDHQDAQTAKFSVLWPAGFGPQTPSLSQGVNWDDWMGQPVVMSWTDPASGTVRNFFRGKISDVALRPVPPDTDVPPGRAPRSRGARVDLVAMGTLADLANRLTGTEAWPEESGDARMNRLRTLAGTLVSGITYRSYWAAAPMAARNVDGTSCLDLLHAMYDTAGGDRLTYDPHTNAIGYVRRRSMGANSDGTNSRAHLRRNDALYPGRVYISCHVTQSWPMLDARRIEGGMGLTRTADTRITRVVTHWTESGGTVAKSSVLYDPAAEASGGIRALDLQTELRDSSYAATCQSDWWQIMTMEGRNPLPEAMTYRADLAGGFDTLAAAQLLIGGAETTDGSEFQANSNLVFIAGRTHAALRVNGEYGVIGGTIQYVDHGWRATINTARNYWEATAMQTPVTCGQLLANPTRDAFRLNELGHSITWNDLRSPSSW